MCMDVLPVQTEYFNNYLLDPKRPQLPEHPMQKNRSSGNNAGAASGGGDSQGGFQGSGGGGYGGAPYNNYYNRHQYPGERK